MKEIDDMIEEINKIMLEFPLIPNLFLTLSITKDELRKLDITLEEIKKEIGKFNQNIEIEVTRNE